MKIFGSMPNSYNLTINSNHDLINKILEKEYKEEKNQSNQPTT